MREIAKITQLNPGYVSKLLETLDAEALVDRSKRGRVDSVNIRALLNRWAESYNVFTTNESFRFVAPQGANALLNALRNTPNRLIITGSFAAVTRAPVTAPALLMAYSDSPTSDAQQLQLLPSDEGANVILLRPYDLVVWQRDVWIDQIRYVAPSQAAIDCLTGNGRMPAEGDALIKWMTESEIKWRIRSSADLQPLDSND